MLCACFAVHARYFYRCGPDFQSCWVLDTKTRPSERPESRRTQMALYCNGDVEKRFTSL